MLFIIVISKLIKIEIEIIETIKTVETKIMEDIQKQKTKLQQKKNKIAAEEVRLNIKERKIRTRHLIEVGGLVVKAKLDHLPINTFYGALLSLKNNLTKDNSVQTQWTSIGKNALDKIEASKIRIILKLPEKPSIEIRATLRNHGLKWNSLREEWYGYITNIDSLKNSIGSNKYDLEIIK